MAQHSAGSVCRCDRERNCGIKNRSEQEAAVIAHDDSASRVLRGVVASNGTAVIARSGSRRWLVIRPPFSHIGPRDGT